MKTKGKAYLLKPGVIMKKWILMLFVMVGMVSEMMAGIKLGGVEVTIQRGRKEWNADRTETFCVGKGLCVIVIKANVDIGMAKSDYQPGTGLLSYDNNQLSLVISQKCLSDSYWSDLFIGGKLHVGSTIELDPKLREIFGSSCPRQIKAGDYSIQRVDDLIIINFQ